MLDKTDIELKHRAVLDLHGFFLVLDTMEIVENPKIIIETLKPAEFFVMDFYDQLDDLDRLIVEEGIVKDNVNMVYGYSNKINLEYTSAGLITTIAKAVLELTLKYLQNTDGKPYEEKYDNVAYYENVQAIVAHYLNIPFNVVEKFSISELFHKHAICSKTFVTQVNPLMEKREEHLPPQPQKE